MTQRSTSTNTRFLTDEFGVRLSDEVLSADLVSLALRRNPRRAHLLVSNVLGKHVPVDPRIVHGTGLRLGAMVAALLDGVAPVVLGFAETATGLGHCVAEALHARYLHSTRRQVPGVARFAEFVEEHSHATDHLLLPEDPGLLSGDEPLVLVDDELSTGRTALNTISAIHTLAPRRHYVLAALVDVRSAADRSNLARRAAEFNVRIDVVALATGGITVPADLAAAAASVIAQPCPNQPVRTAAAQVSWFNDSWPTGTRESGRHGFGPADVEAATNAAQAVADALGRHCGTGQVLVLGTEELMYAPMLIGCALADRGVDARTSATTRSPVVALAEPTYPVRDVLTFNSHDDDADEPGTRYAYNVGTAYSDIVVVIDAAGNSDEFRNGLLQQLAHSCARLHVVVLPTYAPSRAAVELSAEPLRGPMFGSYPERDVGWLLTDLSHVALEAPTEEREEAIQSGGAHYAESLPIEYQPSAEYQALFDATLAESARRIACAVGVVTELVLAERGPCPVLASLARAGTPIGVLMRRWAQYAHQLELPHYAVSIVRGRGIDTAALRYLASNHRPSGVVFVDGWTGKGAIVRELQGAIDLANAELGTAFRSSLAVLADPGACAETFGTREDFLVPSACLNSTVSGLVSRTVRNDALLPAGVYHGAKYYRELAASDVSLRFIDTITAHFDGVAAEVDATWPVLQTADRRPTWRGWADVERLSEQYGINDVTLVKPGVGETTRVLLRRVPWAVLVHPDATEQLRHVRLLAKQRGVPVHEVDDLTYSCVGLIHPRYTRGATGVNGRVAK